MATIEKLTGAHVDRLRAGLLDDDLDLRDAVRAALEPGGRLAGADAVWDGVREQLDASQGDNRRLTNQLRIRRRAVLSGKWAGAKRLRFTLPQMAIATATSVALTLGIVSLLGERPPATDAPISHAVQVASTDLANAYVSNVVDIELDLTDNVDFYAWMEKQANAGNGPRGGGT